MQWVVALCCLYTSNPTPLLAEGGKFLMSLIMPVGGRSLFAERGMILRIHLVFSWWMLVLAGGRLARSSHRNPRGKNVASDKSRRLTDYFPVQGNTEVMTE